MTSRVPSYTVAELEEETGFDRRTIAYYVQEDLLPRVGRRGPRTRYPRLVRDRLLFIRRVREAEEAGRVPAVSLSELRRIFERVSPALVAAVADGRISVTGDLVQPASTGFRLPALRQAALQERLEWQGRVRETLPRYDGALEAAPSRSPSPATPEAELDDSERESEAWLAGLLSRLQTIANRRCEDRSRSMDTWTRIDITPGMVLSVRNVTEEDRELVEEVRRALRRAISTG